MIFRATVVAVILFTLSLAHPASAGNSCAIGFDAKTSGFTLNPKLDSLIVSSAKPKTANDSCLLKAGDEILQVNQQQIPGARALAVRSYWKALKADAPIVFRVKRAGSVLTLSSSSK